MAVLLIIIVVSLVVGIFLGALAMSLGLAPVVAQISAIVANKNATIADLTQRLTAAEANAADQTDLQAVNDLKAIVDAENTSPVPTP